MRPCRDSEKNRAELLADFQARYVDALFADRMAEAVRDKAAPAWEHVNKSTDRDGADLSFLQHLRLD
ncbi:hypothetical protein EC912_10861 [Luteibacter rhizovicinus]|uniref:Uncharacterized protein n=1 Tax=Luteibacter rhizovicinus TaxID=242606 RepID=A0A4V2W3I0_9GAMM|nr:hypothetical protein [Luteibacter rhizovicinus]TCV92069.1 hypothetical protein EC912_10861 [Luteibacter rhizovicinus]